MKVSFKTSTGKTAELDCEASWTIQTVKEKLVAPLEIPSDQIRVVFKGRITKDDNTLESLNVTEGSTMHVVKQGITPATSAAPPQPAAAPRAPTTTTPPPAGLGGLGGFGGAGGFPGFDANAIGSLLQNPQIMEMVQQTMRNPEMLQSMMQNNPLLRQMGSDPAMMSRLSDPETMRQLHDPENLQRMQQAAQNLFGAQGEGMPRFDPNLMASLMGGNAPANQQSPGGGDLFANLQRMMQDSTMQSQMQQMMQSFGGMPSANAQAAGGQGSFTAQLQQLQDMGFLNEQENLEALRAAGGDVNGAIARLLERSG